MFCRLWEWDLYRKTGCCLFHTIIDSSVRRLDEEKGNDVGRPSYARRSARRRRVGQAFRWSLLAIDQQHQANVFWENVGFGLSHFLTQKNNALKVKSAVISKEKTNNISY